MYSNCRSLPLYNFQEINETGDLSFLLEKKKENVDEEKLKEVYNDILQEYQGLLDDQSSIAKYRLRAEIIYCYKKFNNLISLFQLLEMDFEFDDHIMVEINNTCARYNTKFDEKSLKYNLDGITNRLNRKLNEYELLKDEISDNSFDDLFVSIAKAYGMPIDKRKTSVSEWASIINSVKKNKAK